MADVVPKRSNHFIKIGALIIAFILIGMLFINIQHLRVVLRTQQNQLDAAMAEIINLQNANTKLTDLLKDAQSAQTNLKAMQAASASLAVLQLRHDLLQGQNKDLLLNDFTGLQTLAAQLHSSSINTYLNQVQHALNNLPVVNPFDALNQLSNLQAGLANLSFINSIPIAQSPTNITQTFSFSNLWQALKSLVIVRTDNAIGAQLVSDAARFDAVRQLNLLIEEASWQILTMQDPGNTLIQLKITLSAYTEANQNQAAWLVQLSHLQSADDFYTQAQIAPLLAALNNLQQALNL
jgi:hypothetical protein